MDDRLSLDDFDHLLISDADIARLDAVKLRTRRKPSKSWAKMRAYRQRQRAGLEVLRITVPRNRIIEFLIASERLTAAEALDRGRVEHAVADVVVELATRWPRK